VPITGEQKEGFIEEGFTENFEENRFQTWQELMNIYEERIKGKKKLLVLSF
jgi:hypothetical protein